MLDRAGSCSFYSVASFKSERGFPSEALSVFDLTIVASQLYHRERASGDRHQKLRITQARFPLAVTQCSADAITADTFVTMG
jgi:hypothetical protein